MNWINKYLIFEEQLQFLKMGTQEDEGLGFGSSLPVPSVQEIVRNDARTIPERYILNPQDRPIASDICSVSDDIPVIDLSLLAEGDADERRKLDAACHQWGLTLLQPCCFLKQICYQMLKQVD